MSGYEWHAKHSEQGFGINQRELLQISNPSQQNQRGCLLSTGPLYFLYFLARHMDEHLPVLSEMKKMLAKWAEDAEPDEQVPRRFEMTPFTTGGCTGMCMSKSFSLLRLQAVLDCLSELPAASRADASKLLTRIGGTALLDFKLSHRLERRNNRLKLALNIGVVND
jgi:hypothetical protein